MSFREKSYGERLWQHGYRTSPGAAEEKVGILSETSDGGHRYKRHVSGSLQ